MECLNKDKFDALAFTELEYTETIGENCCEDLERIFDRSLSQYLKPNWKCCIASKDQRFVI